MKKSLSIIPALFLVAALLPVSSIAKDIGSSTIKSSDLGQVTLVNDTEFTATRVSGGWRCTLTGDPAPVYNLDYDAASNGYHWDGKTIIDPASKASVPLYPSPHTRPPQPQFAISLYKDLGATGSINIGNLAGKTYYVFREVNSFPECSKSSDGCIAAFSIGDCVNMIP